MNRFFNGAILKIALLSILLPFLSLTAACSGKVPPPAYSADDGEFRRVNPENYYTKDQIKDAKKNANY